MKPGAKPSITIKGILVSFILCCFLVDDATAETLLANVQNSECLKATANIKQVKQLMIRGLYKQAEALLAVIPANLVDPVEIDFLTAQIYGLEGKWGPAANIYKHMLAKDPSLLRVRLELARAFFELEDDANAKKQFEAVLATKELPAAVVKNIRRYLRIIKLRKSWSLSVGFGIAPDTNINSATNAEKVVLFGLPFDLSDDARRSSGIGLIGDLTLGYRWALTDIFALKFDSGIRHTEYLNGTTFNNTIFNNKAGPVLSLDKDTDLQISAVSNYTRFSGKSLFLSYGGQIDLNHKATDRLYLNGLIDAQKLNYQHQDYRDGWTISAIGQFSYMLSRQSVIRSFFGLTQENTQQDALSNRRYRLGLSYGRELPYGVTIELSPEYSWRHYKGVDRLYGKRRKDRQWGLTVRTTKRDFSIFGFIPALEYSYLKGHSNIDFYSFSRHRVNIGFTQIF